MYVNKRGILYQTLNYMYGTVINQSDFEYTACLNVL